MLRDNITQEVRKLDMNGLFFAIGHAPATKFLNKQLELDEYGYIVTKPDSTATSVPGVWQGLEFIEVFRARVCQQARQRKPPPDSQAVRQPSLMHIGCGGEAVVCVRACVCATQQATVSRACRT